MPIPEKVTDALELLEEERDELLSRIEELQVENRAAENTLPSFEQLMVLYRKRDRLANVINNLKAYYDAD